MTDAPLPEWEQGLIEEAIGQAQRRLDEENARAHRRAVQLAREQGYHRLALAIDRPARPKVSPGQLALFGDSPTLFDDGA